MYVEPNFKTKKTRTGSPYPEPHRWYAQVETDDDLMVTAVLS